MVSIVIPEDTIITEVKKCCHYTGDYIKKNLPSQDEFFKLVWMLSHFATLGSTLFYCYDCFRGSNMIFASYELALYASLVTYSFVLYQEYAQKVKVQNKRTEYYDNYIHNKGSEIGYFKDPNSESYQDLGYKIKPLPLTEFLKSEDAHLLVYTSIWLSTPKSLLKLIPLASYSFLNLAHHLIEYRFPDCALSEALLPFIEYIEQPILSSAAHMDLAVVVLLVIETFKSHSAYALAIYLVVWGLRVESSFASRGAIGTIVEFMDSIIETQYYGIAAAQFIKDIWISTKKELTKVFQLDRRYQRIEISTTDIKQDDNRIISKVSSAVRFTQRDTNRRNHTTHF